MAKDSVGTFEIPREMRSLAEQSIQQARKALDSFFTAAERAATTMEGQASAAQLGAKDMRRRAMTLAEKNLARSFEFAEKLVKARDAEEVVRLQTQFVSEQMQALAEQAQELGQAVARSAMEAARPKG